MSQSLHGMLIDGLETSDQVEYRIASTARERAQAFAVVYHSYLEGGLGEPNPFRMRVTPYHLLRTTEIFIATYRDEVIFTMSLIIDDKLGLPIESVFPELVETRREQGKVLAEVSCLADRRSQFRGFFPVFLRLSRLMVQYARRRGVDELLVAVHPRHSRFYRRCLEFHPVGEQRAYPTVRNHPAVALSLDFARLDRERPPQYHNFFGNPLPREVTDPQPITEDQVRLFQLVVDPRFQIAPLGFDDAAVSSPCYVA